MSRLSATLTAALVSLSVTSACSMSESPETAPSVGTTTQRIEQKDQKPRVYRHYVAAYTKRGVSVKAGVFDGLILLPDLDDIFARAGKSARYDEHGNLWSGWMRDGASSRSVIVAPKGLGANVLTLSDDGTVASTIDLDGDGVVDVADMLTAEGQRHVFLTEQQGVAAFVAWLRGANPLCREAYPKELGPGAFGCEADDTSGGAAGGVLGQPGTRGSLDPLDALCEGRASKWSRVRPGVMAHGGHGYGNRMRWSIVDNLYDRDARAIFTRTYHDEDGNHVSTYRSIYERYEDGSRREIHERVSHDGTGTRRVVDHGADGTTKTYEEEITATFDAGGAILGTEPPAFDGDTPMSGGADGSSPVDESTGTPGPSGSGPDHEAALAEWCERRAADNRSGAERAADEDHRDTGMDCDDPVINPNPAASSDGSLRDCGVGPVERRDVDGVIETGVTTCGAYEQPGPDGTCGKGSRIDQLRGGGAWIGMAKIVGLPICNPMVCQPL